MERSQAKKPGAPGPKTDKSAGAAPPSKPAVPKAHPAAEGAPWSDKKATAQATRAANARQVSGRRRFVDPTTCERDYSDAEMEFMQAMQDYKLSSGRMFPTWSEVLEVLSALGYAKPGGAPAADSTPRPKGKAVKTA